MGVFITVIEKRIFWNTNWRGPFAAALGVTVARGLHLVLPPVIVALLVWLHFRSEAVIWVLLFIPVFIVMLHVFGYVRRRILEQKKYRHYLADLLSSGGRQRIGGVPTVVIIVLLFTGVFGIVLIIAILIFNRGVRATVGRAGRAAELEPTPLRSDLEQLLRLYGYFPTDFFVWVAPESKYFSPRTPLISFVPKSMQAKRTASIQLPMPPFHQVDPDALLAGAAYQLSGTAHPESSGTLGCTGYPLASGCVLWSIILVCIPVVGEIVGKTRLSGPMTAFWFVTVMVGIGIVVAIMLRLLGLARIPYDRFIGSYAGWSRIRDNGNPLIFADAIAEWIAYQEGLTDQLARHQLLLRLGFRRFASRHAPQLFEMWRAPAEKGRNIAD